MYFCPPTLTGGGLFSLDMICVSDNQNDHPTGEWPLPYRARAPVSTEEEAVL